MTLLMICLVVKKCSFGLEKIEVTHGNVIAGQFLRVSNISNENLREIGDNFFSVI